ncbi:hypothetical protein [Myxococcus sp. CA040A]|uniref:hypothetical protein n=1 Tax=Myxococcus sp. CA040A TaxID=2741738 RepID=UPI00157A5E35|nr:hypothetical protein [Myxococcus sp. CA040A]NTX08284.1 hypothetical protein [Myxococcus sp. CA040A]
MSPRVGTVALAGLALASSCVAGLSARADAHQWHAALKSVVSVVLVLGAAALVRAAFRRSCRP